jgi:integrase
MATPKIRERSDGFFVGQLELPRGADGQRRVKRVVRKTEDEAREALADLRRRAGFGQVELGRGDTVATFLRRWITDVVPGDGVAPGTIDRYRRTIDGYLVPELGGIVLADLTPADVDAALHRLAERGLSPTTIRSARSVLQTSLRYAERHGLVARNVAALVDGPRGGGNVRNPLTAEEARRVLAAAADERLEAFVYLVLRLGLRKGEALGLDWASVDWDRESIRVRRSTTKTDASERSVPLVNGTLDALRRAHERSGRPKVGRVFRTVYGTPLSEGYLHRWWAGLLQRAGVRHVRIHDCRHTCAELLLADGVPIDVVSKVLGHSSLGITHAIYAGARDDAVREALRRLG